MKLTKKEIELIEAASSDVYYHHNILVEKAVKEYDFAKKYECDEDIAKEVSYEATACWSRWHELRNLISKLTKENEDDNERRDKGE